MDSIDFKGSNCVFNPKLPNEKPMRAYKQGGIRITCWRPTLQELQSFIENKEVFLTEFNGNIKLSMINPIPTFLQLDLPKPLELPTKDEKNSQG